MEKLIKAFYYLSVEHRTWRDFHVVSQFKITKEVDSLSHTDVPIRLETHICHRSTGVYKPDHVLCDDVESWGLQSNLLKLSISST